MDIPNGWVVEGFLSTSLAVSHRMVFQLLASNKKLKNKTKHI